MTALTPSARAKLEAQQADIAAQLQADNVAAENTRRAEALAKVEPLVGVVGGDAWNAHIAAVVANRQTALPPELFSAAEHYLTTAKSFGAAFSGYVADLQPMTDIGPVHIPAQGAGD